MGRRPKPEGVSVDEEPPFRPPPPPVSRLERGERERDLERSRPWKRSRVRSRPVSLYFRRLSRSSSSSRRCRISVDQRKRVKVDYGVTFSNIFTFDDLVVVVRPHRIVFIDHLPRRIFQRQERFVRANTASKLGRKPTIKQQVKDVFLTPN